MSHHQEIKAIPFIPFITLIALASALVPFIPAGPPSSILFNLLVHSLATSTKHLPPRNSYQSQFSHPIYSSRPAPLVQSTMQAHIGGHGCHSPPVGLTGTKHSAALHESHHGAFLENENSDLHQDDNTDYHLQASDRDEISD
ncbi:hypothetical protein MJO28_014625 [Puccinia striiformis f. sp. tritici]|uniref:Uncharacterized protein n=1 Tax=Puccinia striiformis f. sp. tritici TaxID=168172 RepID=A0ACC0DUQ0_9BASI|nr:hypothetical protein MJO28_014625 [Puccinia striiformis f. sp. tritici]